MKKTLFFAIAAVLASITSNGQIATINITSYGLDAGTNPGQNTFYGYASGRLTTGQYNAFTGFSAGSNNTTGEKNVITGAYSGNNNTTGSQNVFLGTHAGFANTTGSSNVFCGFQTGIMNTTGNQNCFVGSNAGYNRSSGTSNSFFGSEAGYLGVTGDYNCFFGSRAGYNTSGSNNVFTGSLAGYSNVRGSNNVFNGSQAGYSTTTGNRNVFVGSDAGYSNTTGTTNTYMGYYSGRLNVGTGNVFVGNYSGASETARNNTFILANSPTSSLLFGDFSTKQLAVGTNVLTTGYAFKVIGGLLVKPTEASTAPALSINTAGNVSIGTSTVYGGATPYMLSVNGKVACKELKVDVNWADYVFADDYALRDLKEVEQFIAANKHLPDVPSAAKVEADGLMVGEMQAVMMQKIEELTLYIIEQQKQIDALKCQK